MSKEKRDFDLHKVSLAKKIYLETKIIYDTHQKLSFLFFKVKLSAIENLIAIQPCVSTDF